MYGLYGYAGSRELGRSYGGGCGGGLESLEQTSYIIITMKRSEFLKRLGLGIAAIPFAKQVAGAVTEVMNDEAGNWPDPVPKDPEWSLKWAKEVYAHHEEPWIYTAGGPFRINDILLVPDNSGEIEGEAQYMVIEIHKDPINGEQIATCLPLIGDGPKILLTKENSKSVLTISNSFGENQKL